MGRYFALTFGPIVVALVATVLIWWRTKAHGWAVPTGALRRWTIVAAVVPLLVVTALRVLGFPLWALRLPQPLARLVVGDWFVVPIVLAVVAVVLLLFPWPARRAGGVAEISRRTMWSFASGRLLFWFGVLVAVVLALTVAAGFASEPDGEGRYRMYWVRTGETVSGTEIYGWYYSVPALVLLAVLVLLTLLVLARIGRPPLALGGDRDRDIALRRLRGRNVLLTAIGGVASHLAAVLQSLAATSSMGGGLRAGSAGWIQFGTPFAAIGPALWVASGCLLAVGLAAWLTVLFSVLPVPSRSLGWLRTRTTADRP